MMKRKKLWEKHLRDWHKANLRTPFQYGTFDCCVAAADAVLAITGTDFAAPFRGTYTNLRESIEVLEDHGGTVDGVARVHLGLPMHPRMAQRGDVLSVMPPNGHGATLGIDFAELVAVPGKKGLQLFHKKELTINNAWRI